MKSIDISAPNTAYTPAEAQAILVFVKRALNQSDKRGGSIGYSIQIELNKMCEQLNVEQGFERILPTMADEGLGYVGPSFEVAEL